MNQPTVVDTRHDCTRACLGARAAGHTVALVPTMGYLHAGHEALIGKARAEASYVVATVFVNPAQFGPDEDLDRYPRDLDGDIGVCKKAGVDLVFAPSVSKEMYPEGFQTWVSVDDATRHFCGAKRKGHFRGVTTIVARLFNLVRPDVAFFGEKDFQQLVAIRTMVRDLDMGLRIEGVPTVREPDGLAVSSRNSLLSEEARKRAVCLVEGIRAAQAAFGDGERAVSSLVGSCRQVVESAADEVDYVAIADPDTMEPLEDDVIAAPDARLLVAAFIEGTEGAVRLIDNAAVGVAT